jgi:hypothetical protein
MFSWKRCIDPLGVSGSVLLGCLPRFDLGYLLEVVIRACWDLDNRYRIPRVLDGFHRVVCLADVLLS